MLWLIQAAGISLSSYADEKYFHCFQTHSIRNTEKKETKANGVCCSNFIGSRVLFIVLVHFVSLCFYHFDRSFGCGPIISSRWVWWTRGALIFSHCHYHAIYHTFRDYSFAFTDSRWFDDDTGCPQDNDKATKKKTIYYRSTCDVASTASTASTCNWRSFVVPANRVLFVVAVVVVSQASYRPTIVSMLLVTCY